MERAREGEKRRGRGGKEEEKGRRERGGGGGEGGGCDRPLESQPLSPGARTNQPL